MAITIGNISLTGTSPYYNMGTMTIPASGTNYTYSTGSNGAWVTSSSQNSGSIHVKGDAEFEGRVMINGQDLAETLQTIQDRLAILVPDPKLLKKYEALQQAYDHYKTLEALCIETDSNDKQ